MSVQENKAVARRWYEEGMAKGNLAVIDELFTTDFRDHNPQAQAAGVGAGREGLKRYFEGLRASIKDARHRRGCDRGGGQGGRSLYVPWDHQGRLHGHPRRGQVDNADGHRHPALRGRQNRGALG